MPPVREVRGMWVVRESLTSPEKIRNIVAVASHFGFNTLFVQVRGRGDALYNSSLEPRSEELAGQPVSFDPLATIISDAHAHNIQVHAWLNTFYVWGSTKPPVSPDHVVNAHPDWLVQDRDGRIPLTPTDGCEGAFLSPANAAACQHIHDVFLEVAKNYDIDGIHFDYVRYPSENYDYSPAALQGFSVYMNPKIAGSEQRFLQQGGSLAYIHAFPDQWADWRRNQVTQLVASISHDVKALKPWVIVSAAVFANAQDAYTARGQDWKTWLKDGLIDVVIPMAYDNSSQLVGQQLKDAETTAHEYGKYCYAGIGSWHITPQSTCDKINIARELGVQGIVLFSYGGVTQYGNSTNYLSKIDATAFTRPTKLPTLPWVQPRPINAQPAPAVNGG
jgi:uncharacterized lipoprotein YddW (UPF0748 family)